MTRWPPAIERFTQRITEVAPPEGFSLPCWQWDLPGGDDGYGRFTDGKRWLTHRWSYEHHVGPIPDGLELDHLCRNRLCVNPYHLEPVTTAENQRRGQSPAARAVRYGICFRGHEFTPDNTYLNPNRPGNRWCRTCKNERARRYYAEKRSAA